MSKVFFLMFLINSICGLPHFYCTPADAKHFHMLKNLIGSIHYNDFDNLREIAVFNLGLEPEQTQELENMQKVKVYAVEMVNSQLLNYFTTCPSGRQVRGYFAWKPVVIKQALDLFPYVLYLDAGTTVLKPLDNLFEYIRGQGYFLLSCTENENCNLSNRLTKKVWDLFLSKRSLEEQKLILSGETYNIDAGLQGLSRKMLKSYVLPMYEHAKDLELFIDDGTAKFGWGAGRHDQTLFSMYAYFLKLKRHPEGFSSLIVKGIEHPIHIHWSSDSLTEQTIIYRSRHDLSFNGVQYIKYK